MLRADADPLACIIQWLGFNWGSGLTFQVWKDFSQLVKILSFEGKFDEVFELGRSLMSWLWLLIVIHWMEVVDGLNVRVRKLSLPLSPFVLKVEED